MEQFHVLTELYCLLHVHPIRTSPYYPQTDGLVEQFNQTLKAMLRKAVQTEGKDWDKLIPFLLFAHREVPQASTGFSPFEHLYGRLSEDLWSSYVILGKLQRRMMTVLYCTYCLCRRSCRRCHSWLIATCRQHRVPRSGMIGRPERDPFS